MGNDDVALAPGSLVTPALRLVRPLGGGGMGRVWIAEHLGLRTQVVVKLISDELSSNADVISRFSREAAAASQVKSPHVVHMIDYGVASNGSPFIAMELLEGEDLAQRLRARGALSPGEVAAVVVQVSRALMAAHQRGIVHRDIKPDNIFLCDAGGGDLFVKVLDFGVAKSASVSKTDHGHATATGAMVGTPLYMSPEQVLGEKTVDYRTDLWALGVVAFEALTGSVPFTGETVGAIAVAICSGALPRPSGRNERLAPAVDAWFERACARDPERRFRTAREMAEALGAALGTGVGRGDDAASSAPEASSAPARPMAREVGSVTTSAATSRAVPTSAGRATVTGWARANRAAAVLVAAGVIGGGGGILAFTVIRRPTVTRPAVATSAATPGETKTMPVVEVPAIHESPAPNESWGAGAAAASTAGSPAASPPAVALPTTAGAAGGAPMRLPHPARKPPSPVASASTAALAPSAAPSHSATTPTSPKAIKASDVVLD